MWRRTHLKLLTTVVFRALKHPRLGDGAAVQLMDVHYSAEGD